jgi:hypothetical protein
MKHPTNSTDDPGAEEMLMAFHLDRLQSIRKTKGRGARSDGWGSETIPLLREIRAIPRSMEQLNLEMGERYGEREKKGAVLHHQLLSGGTASANDGGMVHT